MRGQRQETPTTLCPPGPRPRPVCPNVRVSSARSETSEVCHNWLFHNHPVLRNCAFTGLPNEVTLIDTDALPPFRDRQVLPDFAIAPAELRSR
jgi:hypothetical protein